ncbi:hypothetical protein HYE82_30490 [Streptomyces sp. BR123]|uniref:hypothetical protein n=1 Tax=Streptomyces sp. BR123 TaxID=2749828 RepID=UPI0015C4540C|nr:hypothetical protein [Streptomyces sp. BR123]NXY98631.1 hypothetical protein [Streptomyces sp. BR123]
MSDPGVPVRAGKSNWSALGYLGVFVWGIAAWRDMAEHDTKCCWEENATPEWMAKTMGFQVPETATDRRAGLKTSSQHDVGLLAFTVPTPEAERFLQPLRREGTEMVPNTHPEKPGYSRSDGFSHLGLPEPETFVEGMRSTSVCPREVKTPESGALRLCVEIHAHEFRPGTTRIYLWAGSEAGIEKPPACRGTRGAVQADRHRPGSVAPDWNAVAAPMPSRLPRLPPPRGRRGEVCGLFGRTSGRVEAEVEPDAPVGSSRVVRRCGEGALTSSDSAQGARRGLTGAPLRPIREAEGHRPLLG